MTPPVGSGRLNKAIFTAIACLFVFISIEVTAQILYRIRYGQFLWETTKNFQVGGYMQRVADSRHITTVPNFSDPPTSTDFVSIDAYGFRRGAQTTIPECRNVAFIGDSVPFGLGVSDRDSMPSKFFEYLRRANDSRCVINAAIPSYTLFQAIARFEYEILGKFKIDTVYLQVHEPVGGFNGFGAQWRPDMDAATTTNLKNPAQIVASIAIVRNALIHFGLLKASVYKHEETFNPADQRSLDFYKREIRRELEHLHDLIIQANARGLVVAPATVPSGPYQRTSQGYHIALEALNNELRQFAEAHKDTVFLIRLDC
jgi:hypothetical protein